MVEVLVNKKWCSVPTNWNELTAKQLVAIVNVFESAGDVYDVRVKLLMKITGMGTLQWIFCKAAEINELLYLTDFLIKENTLTNNPLASYDDFAGPGSDFENLLMCEFVYTENFFLKWKEGEGNLELLDQLVAVLYRKKKRGYNESINKDGDVRISFNENECRYYARKKIKRWPLSVKKAIAFWYDGCRQKMIDDFPDVFTGGGEPAKYGLLECMYDVAKEGAFGVFNEVEKLPVRMVMVSLDKEIRDAQKLKQAST